uniref:Uncharacterized protein n=1 Tax=Rhizophora mucronata TaxID=61149 RepID=A0A2P2KGH3_RHIMU
MRELSLSTCSNVGSNHNSHSIKVSATVLRWSTMAYGHRISDAYTLSFHV